jgi:C4-dicarboxylate-specific signal transduction histidine kinase
MLASETCSMISHELKRFDVIVDQRFHDQPLWVRVDSVQIEQVLLNLLRNALDALSMIPPADRQLIVSTGIQPDGMVYVSVDDNGVGIAGKAMEHLFDPFYSTKESGMGMGLAISQTIMTNHNGRIRADSWPGRGSVFTIELPAGMDAVISAAS